MATFLLVHGAWHDERCWELLVPELHARGHAAHVLTLPGHWDRQLPSYQVSLKRYGQAICNAAEQIGEPLVLVGHSLGGMAISQAAEMKPDLFHHMVYLAAYVPRVDSWTRARGLAISDNSTHMWSKIKTNWWTFTVDIIREHASDLFYHDCEPQLAERASNRLCRQSGRPLVEYLRVTDARCGAISKTYIECLEDRVISPDLQLRMQEHLPFDRVLTLDSSHSPFLSQPQKLAKLFHSIVAPESDERKVTQVSNSPTTAALEMTYPQSGLNEKRSKFSA